MPNKRAGKYDEAILMYQAGLSLEDIAFFFKTSRQAVWEAFTRRQVKMRDNKRFGPENHFFLGKSLSQKRVLHLVEKAVQKGILKPEPCEVCGDFKPFKNGRIGVEAHHDDYNKPLTVRWLCKKHHYEWHKSNAATPLRK